MSTYYERLVAGLKVHGWAEDPSDRSKYTAFTRPGVQFKLFVGPAGALRQGTCASKSCSIGQPSGYQSAAYQTFLKAGDKALTMPPTCPKCQCGSHYHFVNCPDHAAWVQARIDARAELKRRAEQPILNPS
jgi:hypothetical protein